jgi:hypothetical protein
MKYITFGKMTFEDASGREIMRGTECSLSRMMSMKVHTQTPAT